jgi:hypothetical protein
LVFYRIGMDLDDNADDCNGREKTLTGIRLFKDQVEQLKWLVTHKYRNNRTSADLIRDAVDQFIDREKQ